MDVAVCSSSDLDARPSVDSLVAYASETSERMESAVWDTSDLVASVAPVSLST